MEPESTAELERVAGLAFREVLDTLDVDIKQLPRDPARLGEHLLRELGYQGYVVRRETPR